MSPEQSPPAPGFPQFRPEAVNLGNHIINAVKGSFAQADGPVFAEACCYAFSLLLLAVARPGCGSLILAQMATTLQRMSGDQAQAERLREFMNSGSEARH